MHALPVTCPNGPVTLMHPPGLIQPGPQLPGLPTQPGPPSTQPPWPPDPLANHRGSSKRGAGLTDAGPLPGDPLSVCAAPGPPATLRPARAVPRVTTFQLAGRSMMNSSSAMNLSQTLCFHFCALCKRLRPSQWSSSRTCQPCHRQIKPGAGVLGPLALLCAKRPSCQPEQRCSGSLW